MTVTVLFLPSATCSADTTAPAIYGVPTVVAFPSSTSNTLSNISFPAPLEAEGFLMGSTFKTLSCVTRYCFPPVSIIAIFAMLDFVNEYNEFRSSYTQHLFTPTVLSVRGYYIIHRFWASKNTKRK